MILLAGWARRGLTDAEIAHNIGIAPQTLSEWKNKYHEIADALKKTREVVDMIVENALFRRAVGYTTTEIVEERMMDANQKRRHGGEGELTEREWELAIAFFDNKCCYCGTEMETPTKDHVIPFSKGGKLAADNIVPCCQQCNSSKKDRDLEEWFKKQLFYSPEKLGRIYDYLRFAAEVSGQTSLGELVVTKKITKDVPPDTTALIYWTKCRMPKMWNDKQILEVQNSRSNETGVVMLAPIGDNAANVGAAGGTVGLIGGTDGSDDADGTVDRAN